MDSTRATMRFILPCLIALVILEGVVGCSSDPKQASFQDAGLRWNWNGDDSGSPHGRNLADGSSPHPSDTWAGGDLDAGAPDGASESPDSEDATDNAATTPEIIEVPVDDVECHYVPEVGALSPVLECFWDDPLQKTGFNDVVMAPVVANLTDDNHDLVVDLKDTPDIAFLTYRREEDGCCNAPSVLRVVSGSCQGALEVQGGDKARLREHFWIASPAMDNSGGLAVGDIDGDGASELVAMTVGGGTVAFSEVKYAARPPLSDAGGQNWFPVNAPDAATALTDAQDDEATLVTATDNGATLWLDADFTVPESVAIPTLKIVLRARTIEQAAALTGTLRSGGDETHSEPTKLYAQEGWQQVVFEFPGSPFAGGKQWTAESLAGLEAGFAHAGPQGVPVEVTRAEFIVSWVEQEWTSPHPKGADMLTAVQPAIADLDNDGTAEVVVGRVVLRGKNGKLAWQGGAGIGTNSFFGPIASAADIDLDGTLEVLAGNTAYTHDGKTLWTWDYGSEGSGCNAQGYPCDGFNATGNFDSDPEAEVVIIRQGVLYVLEHTGDLKHRVTLPGDDCQYNEGGPPTVADFDGDERPEIGIAGADYYVVFDLDCCADGPVCKTIPADATSCIAPGIRWQVPNKDCSSRVTGSSVFDFEGDGQAEVIYNDETHFRIFRGTDGTVLFEKENLSHTRLEYPLVADTDNDGNAEIVIVENGKSGYDHVPLQVWGDAQNRWVPTRRIWNQHTYHITNIAEDGTLPAGGETPNWLTYNNFRQNLPDFDPFLAPDLQVDLLAPDLSQCPTLLTLRAKACNLGQLWVPKGVSLFFFDTLAQSSLACAQSPAIPVALDPGQCVVVACTISWTAPPGTAPDVSACIDGADLACAGPGVYNECDESNNTAQSTLTGCP